MLAPRTAAADHRPRCETLGGQLEEDPGATAQCPADHPTCFVGAIRGPNFRASTQFYAESSAEPPSTSPGWFSYSGVTTYTTSRGSIVTRETGLGTSAPIPEATGRASLSMEVITGGTGDFAGATGYFFVNGFVDADRHVSSLVMGKVCRP
jgi:hypothetical protein